METKDVITEFNLDTEDIRNLHRHKGKVTGKEKKAYVVGYNEMGKLYIVTADIRPSCLFSAEVRFDKGVAGDFMYFYADRNGLFSMLTGYDETLRRGTAHYPRQSYGNGMQYFDTLEQVVEFLKGMYKAKKDKLIEKAIEIEEFASKLSIENLYFTTQFVD